MSRDFSRQLDGWHLHRYWILGFSGFRFFRFGLWFCLGWIGSVLGFSKGSGFFAGSDLVFRSGHLAFSGCGSVSSGYWMLKKEKLTDIGLITFIGIGNQVTDGFYFWLLDLGLRCVPLQSTSNTKVFSNGSLCKSKFTLFPRCIFYTYSV